MMTTACPPAEYLYTNTHYKVEVGMSTLNDGLTGVLYKVINRETEVVEAEISSLPSALLVADESSEYLKQFWEDKQKEEATGSHFIVPKKH